MQENQELLQPDSTTQESDQETSLSLSSNNSTYDISSFSFYSLFSTTGVFFSKADDDSLPAFNYLRPYPHLVPHHPTFLSIPKPFSILSSNRGALLCRCPDFSHYVHYPFFNPDFCFTVPAPPCSPNKSFTHPSVLISGYTHPTRYYIVFALQVSKGIYWPYVYDSSTQQWTPMMKDVIDLTMHNRIGRRLMVNTGVTDGSGCVFWLTDVPHYLVTYNLNDPVGARVDRIELPRLPGWPKLQLGRLLLNNGLGLVVASSTDVNLYLLRHGVELFNMWEHIGLFKVDVRPEVMRFENEVPLLFKGELKFWDVRAGKCSDDVNGSLEGEYSLRLHTMPPWETMPARFQDCVPYVHWVSSLPPNLQLGTNSGKGGSVI